jgi:hypothetical protein
MSSIEHLLDWLMFTPRRLSPDAAAITPAEWDGILASAVAHTAAPQLFQRLLPESQSGAVPPSVLQCAFVAMVRQKEHVAPLAGEMAAVLGALNAKGITPVLLKGAHLATLIYPDPSHRPMADFDLLVRREELEVAEGSLTAIGYESERTEPIAEIMRKGHHLPPLRNGDARPIELHFTIADSSHPVSIDIDGLWNRSSLVTIHGGQARVFAVEDMLLYICLHAAVLHHFGEKGLRPLFDVVAVLDRDGSTIDWDAVESRAREWRIERSAYLTFELARRHCGATIPERIMANLKPRSLSAAVLNAAREQLFESPGLRLLSIHPNFIATALTKPRVVWDYVFRRRSSGERTSATKQVKSLMSRYGRFAWDGLRRNREMLATVIRRTRRQVVLDAWLTRKERAAKSGAASN